jgi:hypothetical protein
LLDVDAPSVLAHRCDWEGSTIVAVHELSGSEAITVELSLDEPDGGDALVDLFSADVHPLDGGPPPSSSSRTGSGGCGSAGRGGGCRPERAQREAARPTGSGS